MLEHNKIVYDEVIERLKTSSRVCIVQATGTGKGVIASSLIEDYVNVLVIAPTNAILENYRMNLGVNSENVIFYTYQGISMLLNNQIEELGEKVSLIILDEFHRIGAETWGRKVEMLCDRAEAKGCKTVGLSATPVRYLDNERDMSEEFFKGNVVNGLNIVDAVVSGVLPTFKYVVSYYGYEKDLFDKIERNKEKLTMDIKGIVSNLENNYSIGKIIQKETKELSNNQKWIVFFSKIEELDEFKDKIYSWFEGKVNIFVLHSQSNYSGNMKVLKEFNNSDKDINVLLSVNMLNEGVHIKDIDGVIMMRKTISPIVYLQQLGRALQIGGKNPIIFDFIGNYRRMSLENTNIFLFDFIKEINTKLIENNRKIEKKVIINSYCEEINIILDNLSLLLPAKWTDEETAILVENYAEKGPLWLSENLLKDRSVQAIRTRASAIGLKYTNNESIWTEEEIELLRKYFNIKEAKWISENILTKRSTDSVFRKAYALGLNRKHRKLGREDFWTDEEIEILKEYYEEKGSKWLASQKLARTSSAISSKAAELGYKPKYIAWTKEEDEILRKYYLEKGPLWLSKNLLKNRTRFSISQRALDFKLNGTSVPWAEEDIKVLYKYHTVKTPKEIQKEFIPHRKVTSVRDKMHSLGLSIIKEKQYFTKEQDEILKKYYPTEGSKVIDRLPGVKLNAIHGRANRLGIKYCCKGTWSQEEENILIKYYESEGPTAVLNRLHNRNMYSVKYKASSLGLKYLGDSWTSDEDEIIRNFYSKEGIKISEKLPNRTVQSIMRRANKLGIKRR